MVPWCVQPGHETYHYGTTGGTVKCCAFVLGPLAGGEGWSSATDIPKRKTVVECDDLLLSEGSTYATWPAIFQRRDQAVRPMYFKWRA
jgi:hypothetical protein